MTEPENTDNVQASAGELEIASLAISHLTPDEPEFSVEAHWAEFTAYCGEKHLTIVNKDELNQVLSINQELRGDVIALVNVFSIFSGMFSGDVGAAKLVTMIPKILKDKAISQKLGAAAGIVQKYTQKP